MSFLILSSLAVVFAVVAHVKDPSLPLVGARNGLALLWFIIPRLVPALILAGMLQVVIPQGTVARYFGRQSGFGAICMASLAGVITPGGPMVSVPLLVVLSHSGMALGPLVAYMTAWSLFGSGSSPGRRRSWAGTSWRCAPPRAWSSRSSRAGS